jgi:hypothetical protein
MMKFHADENDTKIAEENESLDCSHRVYKGDIFYVLYDFDQSVMYVCKNCVIVDKQENEE